MDFSYPTKTQQYDTGVLQSIRQNQADVASFLDGVSISNPVAGIKRYNASSGLFEKYSGSAWSEMTLAYLKVAGGTLSGALVLAGDATSAMQPTSLQQVNTALAAKASTSVLAGYAALGGANFTGTVSTTGNLSASGSVAGSYVGSTGTGPVVGGGAVYAANGTLTTAGTFYLSAANATTPIIVLDANDYFAFDRTGNALSLYLGGAPQFGISPGRIDAYRSTFRMVAANDGAYGYVECLSPHLAFYKKTGAFDYYWRRTDDGTSGGANPAQLMDLNDAGNLTTAGLLFGRGGGAGLGQITVQQGGSPSGGAPGDLWFIY